MADAYLQGILGAYDAQAQVRNDISSIAINWFANRCPLVTRSPRQPVASTTFSLVARQYRTRSATLLGGGVANNTATSLTLNDVSPFMMGDVLQLTGGEHVEISADPVLANNTLTVIRGVDSTTASSTVANNTAVKLIGNSRTGSEVNQNAAQFVPTAVSQYCQTWQHPVQLGGSLQATTGFITQPGVATPFDQFKMDALQNLMDDMEVSAYVGGGQAPASGTRPKQKGLKTLIAAANVNTLPTNYAAYKATDFLRDTLQAARSGGGSPDILFVATNFMSAFATWSNPAMRIEAGSTDFGVPIETYNASFLGGVAVIEAPLMDPYAACAITSSEVRMRMKRNEFWNPRGNRGDATEGEWIAEGALEIDNPAHHAWVEGITAFSAT